MFSSPWKQGNASSPWNSQNFLWRLPKLQLLWQLHQRCCVLAMSTSDPSKMPKWNFLGGSCPQQRHLWPWLFYSLWMCCGTPEVWNLCAAPGTELLWSSRRNINLGWLMTISNCRTGTKAVEKSISAVCFGAWFMKVALLRATWWGVLLHLVGQLLSPNLLSFLALGMNCEPWAITGLFSLHFSEPSKEKCDLRWSWQCLKSCIFHQLESGKMHPAPERAGVDWLENDPKEPINIPRGFLAQNQHLGVAAHLFLHVSLQLSISPWLWSPD